LSNMGIVPRRFG